MLLSGPLHLIFQFIYRSTLLYLNHFQETSKDLFASAIHFRKHAPFLPAESIYFGRKLHYKIIVADKKIALTGVADKYNKTSET